MNELVIDRKNFKQNRVAYGISQEEIANRCGLVSTTVSNYERFEGKSHRYVLETIMKNL